MKVKRLSALSIGEIGTILRIRSEHRQRLNDCGICEGEEIECVFSSPFSDPKAYRVTGTVLAIRNRDARDIYITEGGFSHAEGCI